MSVKDYNRWGLVGERYAAKPAGGTAGDEIRWGDTTTFIATIPAAGLVGLTVPFPSRQLVQAQRTARVWSASFFSAVTPPLVGVTWQVLWRVTVGVGNATLKRYVSLTDGDYAPLVGAAFPGDVPSAQALVANFPGGQIVIDANLLILGAPPAVSDYTFTVTAAAQVAPVEREE